MAVSIHWGNKNIFIPKADTTFVRFEPVSGREVRSYDVNDFRLELKALEDDEQGITYDDTHEHTGEKTLSGVTYARFVEIINGYTIEFEDGTYAVELDGANHNISDVSVVNQVQIRTFNSAGLIVAGSGVTAPDIAAIADAVWDEAQADHLSVGSMGESLDDASSGGSLTAADIADAVWDEAQADHLAPGSMGESQNSGSCTDNTIELSPAVVIVEALPITSSSVGINLSATDLKVKSRITDGRIKSRIIQ